MNLIITEKQFTVIAEAFFGKQKSGVSDAISSSIRELYINDPYTWGSVPFTDDCKVAVKQKNNELVPREGVINVFPHSENEPWSKLNRFDTNEKIRTRISNIYELEKEKTGENISLIEWIKKNKYDLFGKNGKYVQELLSLVDSTIISGTNTENKIQRILRRRFPTALSIRRFCSGDIRDVKYGQDIEVVFKPGSRRPKLYVQVKIFNNLKRGVDENGRNFYDVGVSAFLDLSRYSTDNIDAIFFYNEKNNQYIGFAYDKRNIMPLSGGKYVRFYSEPIYVKNIDLNSLKLSQESETTNKQKVYDTFKRQTKAVKLNSLKLKKEELEALIDKIKKEIEFYEKSLRKRSEVSNKV